MSPMPIRTVLLLTGLALTGGWFLGTVTGPGRSPSSSAPSSGPRPLGVEGWRAPAPFREQLRLKLANQPSSPQPSRNPFVFGTERPRSVVPSRGGAELTRENVAEPEPAPELPRGPVLSLSGIASDEQDGTTVFTAIVTDGSQLHFLKVGDTLPGGLLSVVAVTESSVTLADDAGGERTLRLR